MPSPEELFVRDDERDFYGNRYYAEDLIEDCGLPTLEERARSDLSERVLQWLQALLKFRLPPKRVLELGCGHGGFVAILRWAGFDAVGLEVSPWLVEYAKQVFDIPVLVGPLKDQAIDPESYNVIILMGVLEHLGDQVSTLRAAAKVLADDGVMLIQTPRYQADMTYEDMLNCDHPFLNMLIEEHLFIFSEYSIGRFLHSIGLGEVRFLDAIFSNDDMFLIASRSKFTGHSEQIWMGHLAKTPEGRIVRALLDIQNQCRGLQARLKESERDRGAQLDVINDQGKRIEQLSQHLEESSRALAEAEASGRRQSERFDRLESERQYLGAELQLTRDRLTRWQRFRSHGIVSKIPALRSLLRELEEHIFAELDHLTDSGTIPDRMTETPVRHLVNPQAIAVDLTPVLSGGGNGGAKTVATALVHHLSLLLPTTQFVLLTSDDSHDELAFLDSPNVRRICVNARGEQKPPLVNKWIITIDTLLSRVLGGLPGGIQRATGALKEKASRFVWTSITRNDLILKLGADVLLCPFTAPYYFHPGVPTIVVVYDLQYKYYPQFFSNEQLRELDSNFTRSWMVADALICFSNFTRDSVLKFSQVDPKKARAIHLPRPKDDSSLADEELTRVLDELGLKRDRYFYYPANFWPHKNHEMLITAFSILSDRRPELRLKLVCTGAESKRLDELRNAVRHVGLDGKIVFPGFVDEAEVTALYQGCTAVIIPSLHEGFGIPILEALTHRKPVLCSNLGSLPEIGGDAVLFFDPRNAPEIVDAMLSVIENDELRKQLELKGALRLEDFPTHTEWALAFADVIRDVMDVT